MKVLIYPKSVNPYHELLYAPLREQHPRDHFTYLAASPLNFLFFPLVIACKRLQGYRIFHLHWHTFYVDPQRGVPFGKFLSFVNSIVCLSAIKLLGYRLVWTVHNVMPHERHTSNDRFVMRYTARLASGLIVHSSFSLTQMKEAGIPTNKATIIPIGTYGNLYPDTLTGAAARKALGIGADEFVLLFFGIIREYKGLDGLLRALHGIQSSQKIRLVVAGQCHDPALRAELKRLSKGLPVDLHDHFIPDEKVSMYFRAADVVCLPFKEVTTSSSALLALSFGKPVVAPRIGTLRDLPEDTSFLYSPAPDALRKALQRSMAQRNVLAAKGAAAVAYSRSLSWENIAQKTYRLYHNTLARRVGNTASRQAFSERYDLIYSNGASMIYAAR